MTKVNPAAVKPVNTEQCNVSVEHPAHDWYDGGYKVRCKGVTAVREPEQAACHKCGRTTGVIVNVGPNGKSMHAYGSCESDGEITERVAKAFDLEWPRPPAAEPEPVLLDRIAALVPQRGRHEPHVDGPREPTWQELGDHFLMQALGVERLDEVMPAIERLKARLALEERAVEAEIAQRDENAEWADRLAAAIAEHLGVDIGEHSNLNLPWQAALIALEFTASPPSGPSVLSLPQVPEGAVAFIGRNRDGQEVRLTLHGHNADGLPILAGLGTFWGLGEALEVFGALTVVMREPRTWPKLDPPGDLKQIQGASGVIYDYHHHESGVPIFVSEAGARPKSFYVIQHLDGPLTEVIA